MPTVGVLPLSSGCLSISPLDGSMLILSICYCSSQESRHVSFGFFIFYFLFNIYFIFILHHVGGGQKQSDMDDGFQYLYPRKQHGTDSICWIWTVTRTPRLPLVLYKQKSNMQSHPHTWKQALPNPSLFFFSLFATSSTF